MLNYSRIVWQNYDDIGLEIQNEKKTWKTQHNVYKTHDQRIYRKGVFLQHAFPGRLLFF